MTRDFRIEDGSPAINTGDTEAFDLDYVQAFCDLYGNDIPDCEARMSVDVDMNPRPQGAGLDLGAYEEP